MQKYADSGWCAQTALPRWCWPGSAAPGYTDILDGDPSFYRFVGATQYDVEALTGSLGRTWHLPRTAYKPWPSCRWTHHPLTAFLQLKAEHQLHPNEIERVVVRANPMVVAQSERFRAIHPAREIDAEFSHAHTLAMGALGVPAGPGWYAPGTLTDPAVATFRGGSRWSSSRRRRTSASGSRTGSSAASPGASTSTPAAPSFAAQSSSRGATRGRPRRRSATRRCGEKFERMVAGAGPGSPEASRHAARIVEGVDSLEQMDDVGELGQLLALRPATGR